MSSKLYLVKEVWNSPLKMFNRGIGWYKSRLLKKQHICIACFPKSGSTYLARTLQELLGYEFLHYAHMGSNEHDIHEPYLINVLHTNTITHLHMTANRSNTFYLHYYKIKTIVQIRNIYDCIVSLRDHILNESPVWPMAVVDSSFSVWDESQQYDFIIDNFVPWYIRFYVTWYYESITGNIPIYWIQYEQLMQDKFNKICDLLTQFDIAFDEQALSSIIEEHINLQKGKYRLNVGISGRGIKKLSDSQIAVVQNYKSYYPHVDFEKIGL